MHISLDGFVAGPNGEMDWIKVNDEIFDFGEKRISEGDTALYGRVTYEMMENYWPTAADKPTASNHDIQHSKWYKKVSEKVIPSKNAKDSSAKEINGSFLSIDAANSAVFLNSNMGANML